MKLMYHLKQDQKGICSAVCLQNLAHNQSLDPLSSNFYKQMLEKHPSHQMKRYETKQRTLEKGQMKAHRKPNQTQKVGMAWSH
jgi:hypothetical protein